LSSEFPSIHIDPYKLSHRQAATQFFVVSYTYIISKMFKIVELNDLYIIIINMY